MHRREAKKLDTSANHCFRYHPFMNLAARRTGVTEVRMLLGDMRSGSLWRAFVDLALPFKSDGGPSYQEATRILQCHMITISSRSHAKYGRVRWGVRKLLIHEQNKNKT